MRVTIAYLFSVLVWSTTPLAIQWSNSSVSFISAVTLRMIIALVVCFALLKISRKSLVHSKKDWIVFIAGALGLFPTMLLVYWSAQHIPSGLVSVLFGFFPFMLGFFSLFLLNQNIFSVRRTVALVIAVVGLVIINGEQLLYGNIALLGVLGTLAAVVLFGFNSAWLKSVGSDMDVVRQITGSLVVATPFFILTWCLIDGRIPDNVDAKSMIGIAYLSIAGSVVGHTAYFYVVRHCSVQTVGLITLITPMLAMSISIYFAHEHYSNWTLIGCGLIIFSLVIYQGYFKKSEQKVTVCEA